MSNHIQNRRRWHIATGGAVALAIAAGSLTAVASPAFSDPASTSTTSTTVIPSFPSVTLPSTFAGNLNGRKAFAAQQILERLNALQYAIKVVQGDSFLGSDGSTLVTDMQADITGLQALATTIAGATTLDEVNTDIALIYSQFRVYRLMLPVTSAVIVVDSAVNVKLPALSASITLLQNAETSANAPVLAPLISNMQTQSGVVTGATNGLSAELLSYTPADWNANHGLLNGATAEIVVTDRAFQTANKDWQEAARYLRHHGGAPTTTSTTGTTMPGTTTTTSDNLGQAQAYGEKLVSDRVGSLNKAITEVQGDSYLGSDGTTLVADLQADITGLQGLGTTISAATTVVEVNTAIGEIYSQYRVYDFELPAVQDVVRLDDITNVRLPDLASMITKITGEENSSNQGVIGPLVANMQLQDTTATTATSGVSAQVLGITVSDWNSNHGALNGASTDIFVATKALGTAGKDEQRANEYLRRHHRFGGGTTTTTS